MTALTVYQDTYPTVFSILIITDKAGPQKMDGL